MGRGKSRRSIELIATAIDILEAIKPASAASRRLGLVGRGVVFGERGEDHLRAVAFDDQVETTDRAPVNATRKRCGIAVGDQLVADRRAARWALQRHLRDARSYAGGLLPEQLIEGGFRVADDEAFFLGYPRSFSRAGRALDKRVLRLSRGSQWGSSALARERAGLRNAHYQTQVGRNHRFGVAFASRTSMTYGEAKGATWIR